MMDTRDRLEEVGRNIDQNNGAFADDGKQLLGDYISHEGIMGLYKVVMPCVEACPVSIDPLSIIMDMRRYLVMEAKCRPHGTE